MEAKKNNSKRAGRRLFLFIAVIILFAAGNKIFGITDLASKKLSLEFFESLIEENLFYASAIYIIFTVIGSVVLALPGVTFAILAGLLFGPVLGTVLCAAGATGGAMLAFIVGRFFLKDSIKPMIEKNRYIKKWLFDESGKNELFVLMITRLVPVFPYNLQNFAYGITDINFFTYSIGSLVFMLPGTAMYTVGTAGLASGENRILYIGIALLIAVAVTCAGLFFKKKYIGEENDGKADN